jgi:hypothetical protein
MVLLEEIWDTAKTHFCHIPVHRSYGLGQRTLFAFSSPMGRSNRLSSKHLLSLLTSVLEFEIGISSKMPVILISVARPKNEGTAVPEWLQLWKLKIASTLNCCRRILIQAAARVIMIVTVMSVVVAGITTRYGLDGPEIESRWERVFLHPCRLPLWPTQTPIRWVSGINRPGRDVKHLPHQAPA